MPPRVRTRRRSRTPWSHTPHASAPALHGCPVQLESPFSGRTGRLLVRPDAGAVQKGHPELDTTLLGQEQQPLPDTQVGPAKRSAPPATRDQAQPGWRATWPRSDGARRWPTACAAGPEAGSCPWAGIPRSAAPASSSVRLSAWPLLPSQEEQNARNPIQFKREQALGGAYGSSAGRVLEALREGDPE